MIPCVHNKEDMEVMLLCMELTVMPRVAKRPLLALVYTALACRNARDSDSFCSALQ